MPITNTLGCVSKTITYIIAQNRTVAAASTTTTNQLTIRVNLATELKDVHIENVKTLRKKLKEPLKYGEISQACELELIPWKWIY